MATEVTIPEQQPMTVFVIAYQKDDPSLQWAIINRLGGWSVTGFNNHGDAAAWLRHFLAEHARITLQTEASIQEQQHHMEILAAEAQARIAATLPEGVEES